MDAISTFGELNNLLDLPTDILSHCAAFLDIRQLLQIPTICKRINQISLLPSSFNGTFIMPKYLTINGNNKILHRFSNSKTIRFKHKTLSGSTLSILANIWSIDKRRNVSSIYIEKQFNFIYIDSLKSCFPNIQVIHLNANGRNFRNSSNIEYYKKCVIPLIKIYASTLIELNIKFDDQCDTLIIPNQFIQCLENETINLKKFTFGGICMDLTNKHITKTNIFTIPIQSDDYQFSDDRYQYNDDRLDALNTFNTNEIPICGICLPMNININYITELKLNWEVCAHCIDHNVASNLLQINGAFINLKKLSLRICLNGENISLNLDNWIKSTLCYNNINELRIEFAMTRNTMCANTIIVLSTISELISKIIDNNSCSNYKRFIIKIADTDCGNASYIYLFKDILCKLTKAISMKLNSKLQSKLTTYIVEIVMHQLPELIFIDQYHYKPITQQSISKMFRNIMDIKQKEINFRLILQKTSPWTSMICNNRHSEEFFDSLKHENMNTISHIHQSYTWIVYNFVSEQIINNNKQQLLFNITSSTILEETNKIST